MQRLGALSRLARPSRTRAFATAGVFEYGAAKPGVLSQYFTRVYDLKGNSDVIQTALNRGAEQFVAIDGVVRFGYEKLADDVFQVEVQFKIPPDLEPESEVVNHSSFVRFVKDLRNDGVEVKASELGIGAWMQNPNFPPY